MVVLRHSHNPLPLKTILVFLPLEEGQFFIALNFLPYWFARLFKARRIHFFYIWSQLAHSIYKTYSENSMGAPATAQARLFADSTGLPKYMSQPSIWLGEREPGTHLNKWQFVCFT